jgi:hypothetical protein
MPTNRTRISRSPVRAPITPAAIALFEAMRELGCTCAPIDWDGAYWERQRCAGCDERAGLDELLHTELGLRPWETTVENPDARSPYPPGSHGDRTWKPDLEAQGRWRLLAAAAASTAPRC